MSKRPPLNFREWWDTVGTENVRKIVEDLGSSMPYFRLLRYGLKKPGSAQALRIIESARRHTAPFEPDLELLLRGVPRAGKEPSKPIPPSDRFVRARKRIASAEPAEA